MSVDQELVRIQKRNFGAGNSFVKEFYPAVNDVTQTAKVAGRLMIRTNDYSGNLAHKFDRLYEELARDALNFEPPLQIDREDVEVVVYGGQIIRQIPGLEVKIPAGIQVTDAYTRVNSTEMLIFGN